MPTVNATKYAIIGSTYGSSDSDSDSNRNRSSIADTNATSLSSDLSSRSSSSCRSLASGRFKERIRTYIHVFVVRDDHVCMYVCIYIYKGNIRFRHI